MIQQGEGVPADAAEGAGDDSGGGNIVDRGEQAGGDSLGEAEDESGGEALETERQGKNSRWRKRRGVGRVYPYPWTDAAAVLKCVALKTNTSQL
jgi:hypothetical protein